MKFWKRRSRKRGRRGFQEDDGIVYNWYMQGFEIFENPSSGCHQYVGSSNLANKQHVENQFQIIQKQLVHV